MLSLLAGVAGCGRVATTPTGGESATQPAPAPSGPPVVKITASGFDPQFVHLFVGRVVVFQNDDREPHAIFTDPHPGHSLCAGVFNLGSLAAGARREVEAVPGLCPFHDDDRPGHPAFQGYVLLH